MSQNFSLQRRRFRFLILRCLILWIFFFCLTTGTSAQKIAIFAPDKSPFETKFVDDLSENLAAQLKVIDSGLSETAFRSVEVENAFNLSLGESKIIGAVVGCDFFVLIKGAETRREVLDKPAYFEAYAAVYLVNSRSGQLVSWELKSFRADKSETARKLLFNSTKQVSTEIYGKIKNPAKDEITEKSVIKFIESPDENSPEAKNFRAPIPYRRIKPEYPPEASLYAVKATIDVAVEIDADGQILRTETTRWAGFGLEQSVIATIRKMNWRPAMRDGKPLPMRVLLRYNFKKTKKEEEN